MSGSGGAGGTWSPDSSTIAFAKYDRSFSNADIWSIGAGVRGQTQIADTPDGAEVSPAYSPTGR